MYIHTYTRLYCLNPHPLSLSLSQTMSMASSILRPVPLLRRHLLHSISAKQHHNPNRIAPRGKSSLLLKIDRSYSNLAASPPSLSLEHKLPRLAGDQAVGLVAAAQANFMRVIIHSSEPSRTFSDENEVEERVGVELLCVVRAVLKKIKRRVLVGDKVLVGSIDWVGRRGMIEDVFQRKTQVADPPVANVDHLVVLFSMDNPKVEPFPLTRFLVEAESTGIPITLALNKSELADEESIKAWKMRLRKWGYDPVFCSVEAGNGIDTLQFILREQTSVIVGPSGVGKSSLINALRSNQYGLDAAEGDNWFDSILGSKWFEDQRVREVSARSGRGKHTTRNVSLLPLSGGGFLADTPGKNQPTLMKVTKHSLAQHFPEIRTMLKDSEPTTCSFNNCLHVGEPNCVVKSDWERYPYYFQLLDEIKIREEFQMRTVGTKKEEDVRYKIGDMGVKQAEPRLELHKHRRQSRKKTNQSLLDELDEDDDDDDFEDDPIIRAITHENQ